MSLAQVAVVAGGSSCRTGGLRRLPACCLLMTYNDVNIVI